jgi:iron(III) transport system permease protein
VTATVPAAGPRAAPLERASRVSLWSEAIVARGGLVLLAAGLLVFLAVPLAMILVRSVEDKAGAFAGAANFVSYFASPAVGISLGNSLTFAVLTTLVTVPLAFG